MNQGNDETNTARDRIAAAAAEYAALVMVRDQIAEKWCRDNGRDRGALTVADVLAIRALPEWIAARVDRGRMNDQVGVALKRYREIQEAEGATGADDLAIARAQGIAWRDYLTWCALRDVEPEPADNPNLGRY